MAETTQRHEAPKRCAPRSSTWDLPQEVTNSAEQPLSFMDRLTCTDRDALIAKAREERHETGSVICREGEPGNTLYIIKSGQVAIVKEMSDGRPTILGYREAGEIIGEMSVLGQQPRSAWVLAVEDTDLYCIDAVDFPLLMHEHPDISWAILKVLNDRLYEADAARTVILQEGEDLIRRMVQLAGEAECMAELARVRKETIELITHDLRTPLAVLDGCLQMLRSSLPPAAQEAAAEALTLAERSSRRLMTLLEELLKAARQEVPADSLAHQPVDLARLLQVVVEGASVAAEQSDLRLELEVPPHLPWPQGDAARLERMVGNLLDNALSYTPSGGHIWVVAAEGEGEVKVSVTDTGPGVAPEHREHIFERFTRVPGVKGRRQGFGLGLYFCRQVVQGHGGRIWVEPGPGEIGSRFVFTLPLVTQASGLPLERKPDHD